MEFAKVSNFREFRKDRYVRKVPFSTECCVMSVLCFEPRQSMPRQVLPNSDSVFFVAEGKGEFVYGDERAPISSSSIICVPRETPHSIENTGGTRLIVLQVQAPKP